MYLSIRDITFARGRFALIGAVVALITLLLVLLTGLTQGLGHRRIIWHPDVVERVAAFARSYRTELQPSSG